MQDYGYRFSNMDKYNFIFNLLKFSNDMIGFLVLFALQQVLNGMLELTLLTWSTKGWGIRNYYIQRSAKFLVFFFFLLHVYWLMILSCGWWGWFYTNGPKGCSAALYCKLRLGRRKEMNEVLLLISLFVIFSAIMPSLPCADSLLFPLKARILPTLWI